MRRSAHQRLSSRQKSVNLSSRESLWTRKTVKAFCLRKRWDIIISKQTHDPINRESIGIAERRAHARPRLLQQEFARTGESKHVCAAADCRGYQPDRSQANRQ